MDTTIKVREAIERAIEIASDNQNSTVEPIHIFLALIEDNESVVSSIIKIVAGRTENIKKELEETISKLAKVYGDTLSVQLNSNSYTLLKSAEKEAKNFSDEYLSGEHILLSVFNTKLRVKKILEKFGINKTTVLTALKEVRGSNRVISDTPEQNYEALKKYTRDFTRLAQEGKLDPVIGRDKEIRRIMQVLSRRTKNNPVLIGEPGVGKTAIAEGLALRIVSKDVPDSLSNKKVLSLDLGALVAGAKFRGEFEERFKSVIKEVSNSKGEIILFVDELHTLMGAGAVEGSNDASNMLKPALSRGEIRTIGATTLDEYRKYIEKDSAFERRFQPVYTSEPSVEDTISILRGIKEKYEIHHGVRINDEAIIQAAILSNRYITSRFLPDKAIDLMDEAASRLKIEIESQPEVLDKLERELLKIEIEKRSLIKDRNSKDKLNLLNNKITNLTQKRDEIRARWIKEKKDIDSIRELKRELEELSNREKICERDGKLEEAARLRHGEIPRLKEALYRKNIEIKEVQSESPLLKEEVGEEEIADVISIWTGIPISKLLSGEAKKYLELEEHLEKRVVGQKVALKAVSDAIRRNKSGLSDSRRPLGTFLFLGPTGVGKTELSKALADFLFNDEKALTRIDMSEYMEKFSVSRLIGAPPGYVGYDQGGQLTEAVRRRPYSVILFDEIEKAHPDVFNTMLQIFDDGRLTDSQGRVVDFTNSIIILTSNIGSSYILDNELNYTKMEELISNQLKQTFKPEFINRLDEQVIFNRLDRKNIRKIVKLELDKLEELLKDKKLTLMVDKGVKDYLVEEGFDPVLGARPIKRAIQSNIINPLSKHLLDNRYKAGDRINVIFDSDKIVFN